MPQHPRQGAPRSWRVAVVKCARPQRIRDDSRRQGLDPASNIVPAMGLALPVADRRAVPVRTITDALITVIERA